ncbi:MAG TPA: acyl-CoA carboxylase subunit beta [Candidatus Thermoplasmatota archaeon]|nr:acyl-CoA carboxylase subunit beta [Candidatus Thermoplasmatota archaeon]
MAVRRVVERPKAPLSTSPDAVEALRVRKASLRSPDPGKLAKQRAARKLTARERLDYLLDPGSFVEVDTFARAQGTSREPPTSRLDGDGVVAGFGAVDGRPVALVAQDFMVHGGSLGATTARKICKVLEQAMQTGVPFLSLNDSGGARIQEGVAALGGYGDIFLRNVRASGVIPQISVMLGPCAGGAVYSPALTDFVVMTRGTSHMFITGPDVVRAVTGESTTFDELGGAGTHGRNGVAHLVAEDEYEALDKVRALLAYLPQNNHEDPPLGAVASGPLEPSLAGVVPPDPNRPYDMRDVITRLVDGSRYLELQSDWAPSLFVGFARVEGRSVGIVANNPKYSAGVLDVEASEKGARFIRFCDAFNIPILSLVDVPGYMPGLSQEAQGIIRRGAKLLFAYCEATVPKITVVLRKAYGGAYIVMASKHLATDVNLAWPKAEIAVLGAEAAVNIIHKREIQADPAKRAELESAYRQKFNDPFYAAELGFLDDVIEPEETRAQVAYHLRRLASKRAPECIPRKHATNPI